MAFSVVVSVLLGAASLGVLEAVFVAAFGASTADPPAARRAWWSIALFITSGLSVATLVYLATEARAKKLRGRQTPATPA